MKICAMSDLHGILPEITEPCELVLICGDISPLKFQRDVPSIDEWLKKRFSEWVNKLPCKKVIMVAGNHDFAFQNRPPYWKLECITYPTEGKLILLENEYIDYLSEEDFKVHRIYGTPDCHKFGNWAFMYENETLEQHFQNVPENCDIVISHDAPYGISDICFEGYSRQKHIGSEPLYNMLSRVKPRYNFHGHLHTSNHEVEFLNDTAVYNVSLLDETYVESFEPLYINV